MTDGHYYHGTGRRKCSVARVRLYPGKGETVVNDKPLEEVFPRPLHRYLIFRPLEVTELKDSFHAEIKVEGGGGSGWAGAISLGNARALVVADENTRSPLRRHDLLTRDSRVKERKKYGLKRARKAPQYTKG